MKNEELDTECNCREVMTPTVLIINGNASPQMWHSSEAHTDN